VNGINADLVVQWCGEKYSCLRKTEIMYHFAPSRLGKRGVRVVTNVGRDAMDASGID
jgi:hypothetical protein